MHRERERERSGLSVSYISGEVINYNSRRCHNKDVAVKICHVCNELLRFKSVCVCTCVRACVHA